MAERKVSDSPFAGRELFISRVLNAPVELVWEVFTKPEHIKNWWGPNGFTNTITKMEVKPGGAWELTMHGPDGTNYPNKSVFKEVVKNQRIVFQHFAPNFITTIDFVPDGNKTSLKWHMLFESKELFEQVVKNHKADKGLEQNIEKLEQYLVTSGLKTLTITRTFDAPLHTVWKAWTDPVQLKEWWGPAGFTNPVCEWNAQAGSKILIHMKAPDGTVYPMDGQFHEVVKNERIVFTSAALNTSGARLFEILNTIDFIDEGDKTRLVLGFVMSNITPEGAPYLTGQELGWNMSLDKLVKLVVHQPFVIERTFNAPMAKVWSAITNKDEMKQWYFDLADFKPEVGFEFTFNGQREGRLKVHLCKVTEVVTGSKLTYSWRYQGSEGISHVTFELFDAGGKTRLKLTHAGLETFPITLHRDYARENFQAGWTHIIGTSLPAYLG